MNTRRTIAILCLAALTTGCGSSTEPETCSRSSASGFTVSVGTDVVFSGWACSLSSIWVLDPFGRGVWGIEGTIDSPVTYGVVPAGAVETTPPIPLQAGVTYDVYIEVKGAGGAYLGGAFTR